jgi:hypothetical protein
MKRAELMEITLEQYERIQKYLDGKMPPEEEKTFMAELENNSAMKDHLAFEQELREQLFIMEMEKGFPAVDMTGTGANAEENDDIKKRIAETGKNWKQKQNKNPLRAVTDADDKKKVIAMPAGRKKFWYMAAAACAIIAIISIVWISSRPGKTDPYVDINDTLTKKPVIIIKDPKDTSVHKVVPVVPDKGGVNYASIVKKYYVKDEAPFPEDVPQYLRKPLIDFNRDNYDAITKTDVNDLPNTRGDEDETQKIKELGHYYKGLAFIETNNNAGAIENLVWVVDSAKNETLHIKAQWYRGLTYLKSGNIGKATNDFTKLANNAKAIPYNKQSNELLKAIR